MLTAKDAETKTEKGEREREREKKKHSKKLFMMEMMKPDFGGEMDENIKEGKHIDQVIDLLMFASVTTYI